MEQTPDSLTAEAVRVEMARKRVSARSLAETTGIHRNSLYRRLKGDQPFTISQLCAIANYLEVPLNALLPADERAA